MTMYTGRTYYVRMNTIHAWLDGFHVCASLTPPHTNSRRCTGVC
jgi:hypothetical protein